MSQYQKSAKTKQLILDHASRQFFEKGYTATTVREIAKETSLSVNRLNYHFQSKSEVAALICKQFLKCINDQTYRITFPLTDNLILKDIIHIRLLAKAFLYARKYTPFYYEIACDNIISEVLIETAPRHFKEQFDYLGMDPGPYMLLVYSRIFIAALVELIKSDYLDETNLKEEELLDIYNSIHLKLLERDNAERISLMNDAKALMSKMSFEMKDISTIVVKI